jgi:hypothetical protein
MTPRLSKNILYWYTYQEARQIAQRHGFPADRIIEYGLGWAIQFYKSGPYVGPSDLVLAHKVSA